MEAATTIGVLPLPLVQAERAASVATLTATACAVPPSRFVLHGGEHEVTLAADEQGAITLGALNLRRCDPLPGGCARIRF